MAFPLAEFSPARVKGPGSYSRQGPHAEDGGQGLDEDGPHTAIATWSGHAFDLMDVGTWTYDHEAQINDIALALANSTRFGGHIKFYSVAEHSIRVADYLRDQGEDEMTQLLGLWHDATEAYIGDLPRPQKKLMSIQADPVYYDRYITLEEFEHDLALALFEHFGIEYTEDRWATVKQADYAVYVMERSERPTPAMVGKYAMGPTTAENLWHTRNAQLMQQLFDD